MKLLHFGMTLGFFAAAFFVAVPVEAQKSSVAIKSVIFIIWNEGKWIDPIAVVNNGNLAAVTDEENELKGFGARYYKPKTTYPVIFGGAADGSVTVIKSNIGSECGGPSADVTLRSKIFKPSSLVFALASNAKLTADVAGYRRRPTPVERVGIETLVRKEFVKDGASAAAVKTLHFHNLTAVDVENDGVADFVGSYWISQTASERRLLFFIAEQKGADGIKFVYSEHRLVKPEDIMSQDLRDLEEGRGAELLIDLIDYDNDGVREIFTISQAFEGNNYYAYKRNAGKWTRVLETYNYRCAY
jgi:hypothetical protein